MNFLPLHVKTKEYLEDRYASDIADWADLNASGKCALLRKIQEDMSCPLKLMFNIIQYKKDGNDFIMLYIDSIQKLNETKELPIDAGLVIDTTVANRQIANASDLSRKLCWAMSRLGILVDMFS